jgi:hypothetical protein
MRCLQQAGLSRRIALIGAALVFVCASSSTLRAATEPDEAQLKFFETSVRPLLVENCFSCHSAKKQKGGLRLDSQAAVLKGGKNGPVLVPGKPGESRLVTVVAYTDDDLQMPPDEQLSAAQVEVLTRWVQMGAPWPKGEASIQAPLAKQKKRQITAADEAFWSFQPVKAQAEPNVSQPQWCRTSIDRFILAKLEEQKISPGEEADRVTLIRRATFDLHGLPPTPVEIEAFVQDQSPDAYEALIDRLLASPRYGEHWGRHWLDLVRYAESDGFKQDAYRPNAWPYRDYVIDSFNGDKPYDQFITEQLAGDEIAPHDPKVIVATGYLRAGIYEYNNRDVARQWSQMLDDLTDVTGDAILGLSMGCARCHDHKFDPILQADYYRLRSFFAPVIPRNDLPLATVEQIERHDAELAAWERKGGAVQKEIAVIEAEAASKPSVSAIKKFPDETQSLLFKPAGERSPYEKQLAYLALRQIYDQSENAPPKLDGAVKDRYAALKKELGKLDAEKPKPLVKALIMTDVGPVAPPVTIPGDPDHAIEPGYLKVLESKQLQLPPIMPSDTSTGRRTALAKWITQPANPLTSRVIVNRIWQFHFGRGLVATSSDYGRLGTPPTHPELLDWLANRFVQDGWSFKKMHRLMMTSSAYRQQALRPMPEVARLKDPENRWLWRMNTHRLDAEQVRDAMLQASGELKLELGGPSVEQTAPRRAIYTRQLRNTRDPLLEAFDSPEAFGSIAVRNVTTTANQALLMINGDWALKRATSLATQVGERAKSSDPAALIETAYTLAYGRRPQPTEAQAAFEFFAEARSMAAKPGSKSDSGSPATEIPITQTMPQRGGQAVLIRNGNTADMLTLSPERPLFSDAFAIEAYVQLESLYPDARVRVIASQWDGDMKHTGWALGVTGEKSPMQPGKLVLQYVGADADAGPKYLALSSEFIVEPHKAYYVAAVIDPRKAKGGVTFYLKDLTDMDAPMKTTFISHAGLGSSAGSLPFVIGGRPSSVIAKPAAGWDGLIDEVRISSTALTADQLLYNEGDPKSSVAAHWLLKEHPGFFRDSTGQQKDLTHLATPSQADAYRAKTNPLQAALVDFCHVLLNSNEFLYVD